MKTAQTPTDFFTLATDAQPTALQLTGQWTLANYMSLKRALTQFPAQQRDALLHLDFSQLKQLDTAGAKRLCQFIGLKQLDQALQQAQGDRKSTRLNSSHVAISYAVFC